MGTFRGSGTPVSGADIYDQDALDAAVADALAQATAAAASAAAASTSATNAANSETNAATSETNAAASEAAAATSETNAAASEAAAATSESNAAASEAAAAASYDSFDDRYLGAKASDPALDNDGDALIVGAMYFNTASNIMRLYDGSAWADIGKATANVTEWTVTGTTTTFTGNDDNGLALSYTPGYVMVFQNGVLLDPDDYTASNGTSVVLGVAAESGDTVNIIGFGTFDVSTSYTKTEADARFGRLANDNTWTGNQDVGGYHRVTGAATPASGSGVETVLSGGAGYLTAYDRTGAAYLPIHMRGSSIGLWANATQVCAWSSSLLDMTTNVRSSSANWQFYKNNDTGALILMGGSAWAAANSAYISLSGNSHATVPGQMTLVPGTSGEIKLYNGATQVALVTESTGVEVKGVVRVGTWDGGAGYGGLTRTGGGTNSYMIIADGTSTFISTPSASGVINLRPGINGVGSGGNFIVGMSDYNYNGKSQVSYGFNVDSAGTGYGLPSGWSTSKVATGQYRITHNKGDTNYTVNANIFTAAATLRVGYISRAANTCDIFVYGYNNTTATDSSLDIIFHFR